jgi:hypothetical protein
VIAYSVVLAGETIFVPAVEVAVVHGAEQEVMLVEDQVRVEVAPEVMLLGLAERETVGVIPPPPPLVVTVTVVVAETEPPLPTQEIAYSVVAVGETT